MDSSVVRVWNACLNYSLLADVIVEASKGGSEECWLELPTDQGYGATCVPASIDE